MASKDKSKTSSKEITPTTPSSPPLVYKPGGSVNDNTAINKAVAVLSGNMDYDLNSAYNQSAWAGSGGLKQTMYGNNGKDYVAAGMTAKDMEEVNKLAAQYDQIMNQRAAEEARLAAQQEAYNNYYYQMLAAQQREYEQQQAARQRQIDQTVASIEANNETIDSEYQKAQREAYINNILQQNQMNDYLQAMGYTGGLAETTANNLANNYANNRANAVSERDAALRNNERLVAEARVSGDTALADMASNYLNNYIATLSDQAKMNYQIQQDQQAQENADREFAFRQKQYEDSLNMSAEEESRNLAAQDMQTFLNTYQKKYTKKATYEKWIQNLQAMDDPYGFNAQKIAYLRQYINQNFNNGPASNPNPNSSDNGSSGAFNGTEAQNTKYKNLLVKINSTYLYPGAERSTGEKVNNLVAEIQQTLQQNGITEAQARDLLDMMK